MNRWKFATSITTLAVLGLGVGIATASDYSGSTYTYTETVSAGILTYNDEQELVYCPEGQYMLGGLAIATNTVDYRYSAGDAVPLSVGAVSGSTTASNVADGVSYDRVGVLDYSEGQSFNINYICVDNP